MGGVTEGEYDGETDLDTQEVNCNGETPWEYGKRTCSTMHWKTFATKTNVSATCTMFPSLANVSKFSLV